MGVLQGVGRVVVELKGDQYEVDLSDAPTDCSIGVETIDGGRKQPRAFQLPPAGTEWLYRCAVAGRCAVNVGELRCCAHGAGTHTECVGHIAPTLPKIITLDECGVPLPLLVPAVLLSVAPSTLRESGERYSDLTDAGGQADAGEDAYASDLVITHSNLESLQRETRNAFAGGPPAGAALCIRVLPNDDGKRTRNWTGAGAPYFTRDAVEWIVAEGYHHLLVDMPSVDREDDGGRLVAHRALLRAPMSGTTFSPTPHTITELCFFPDSLGDGSYMLSLQVPKIDMDAAPSRVLLYRTRRVSKEDPPPC